MIMVAVSKVFTGTSYRTFDPNLYVISFDDPSVSANHVKVVQAGDFVEISIPDKTFFISAQLAELTSSNFVFADGSHLVIGDDTVEDKDDDKANDIVGTEGGDNLQGLGGNDNLHGGAGNDFLKGGAGVDMIDGGEGTDTAAYDSDSNAATIIKNADGSYTIVTASEGIDAIYDVEKVQFKDKTITLADIVYSPKTGVVANAYSPIDMCNTVLLDGDPITTESPTHEISFLARSDSGEIATFTGDFRWSPPADKSQIPSLGGTINKISVELDGVVIREITGLNLSASTLMALFTSQQDGTLTDSWIFSGDDMINGSAGDDFLRGYGGNDTIFGGAGSDVMDGGDGDNWASYARDPSGVHVNLKQGRAIDGWDSSDDPDSGGTDVLSNINNVEGSNFDDGLIGNDKDNRLNGRGGDDLLDGGAGNDTLDGGAGVDTVLIHATRAQATIVRNADGSLTVSTTTDGVDKISHVEYLKFSDQLVRVNPKDDFNGDGVSDVLLQNAQTTQCFIWDVNGASAANGIKQIGDWGAVAWTPPQDGANDWRIKGPGDFNRDGVSDILLQNLKSGGIVIWELSGQKNNDGTFATKDWGIVPEIPRRDANNDWQVKATGDFNGDGVSDILLQNGVDGELRVWEIDGGKSDANHNFTILDSGKVDFGDTLPYGRVKDWQVKATGDFNGDGASDILFQNAKSGDCFIWEQHRNLETAHAGLVGWSLGGDWEVKATGDFNGDGVSDILLQNVQTTQCYLWEVKGQWRSDAEGGGESMELLDYGAVGWRSPKDATQNWQVKGAGDYNGDGLCDILLQNTVNSQCFVWEVDGTKHPDGVFATPTWGAVGWRPATNDWHA